MEAILDNSFVTFSVPKSTLVNQSFPICLSGFSQGQHVTIRAKTKDGERKIFESYATFIADIDGNIDSSIQKPISGTYDEVDSMGLFWSMKPEDKRKNSFFIKTKSTPLIYQLTAEVDGKMVAETEIERFFVSPTVAKMQVEDSDLIGTLYYPKDSPPIAGVIVLSGSDGGSREDAAALLAAHGFAALALPYFGVEDLPKNLMNIPLEYFGRAIHWLQDQSFISNDRIGVIGLSRGGELALLLGTKYPEISAVIAASPSAYHYAGLSNFRPQPYPSWTYHNEPLHYLKSKFDIGSIFRFYKNLITRQPISNLAGFYKTLKDRTQTDAASIPVEHIKGSVMLISGGDDQLWPSSLFAETVMERLDDYNHPYSNIHLHYKDAGHFLCFPYVLPNIPPNIMMSPWGGMTITFGGSDKANTKSSLDSWPKILDFLKKNLA
ncbi:acyl-CoA thioester hydrolase/BAAT C-terminal domain-containing protein [Ectobacillus polymachus]|uniref:acyl-CoA thioester hydrolase/BAAT C-terminal domain-containing protein n=1 Tax=Ectobacillus polymachus TaxID=1508806 RepID=UPI003A884891